MTQPTVVLIIGSGGREHALAWAVTRDPRIERVLVAPGNGGTALEARVRNVDLKADDAEGLIALAEREQVGLTIVGPENPLAAGLVDRLQAAGLRVFGPSAKAARLESSKAWARAFMARHGVPSPAVAEAVTLDEAADAIRAMGGRCVIKADGLAAGKGVVVCASEDEALAAAREMLVDGRFGEAGARLLVEERLEGPELSVMAICDGLDYRLLPPAQDHKRIFDGDRGPNTGGMGAYAPAPIGTPALLDRVRAEILEPTLRGMTEEGQPFRGCLFMGLMLTGEGPKVIEFNVRFGDPETQVQLPLVRGGLVEVLAAAAEGDLGATELDIDEGGHAACVVLASAGYPGSARTDLPVEGLAEAERGAGVKVFHAGTRLEDGTLLTSGGRALNVTCLRPSLEDAVAGAYAAIGEDGLRFEGMQHRRDIAARALDA